MLIPSDRNIPEKVKDTFVQLGVHNTEQTTKRKKQKRMDFMKGGYYIMEQLEKKKTNDLRNPVHPLPRNWCELWWWLVCVWGGGGYYAPLQTAIITLVLYSHPCNFIS